MQTLAPLPAPAPEHVVDRPTVAPLEPTLPVRVHGPMVRVWAVLVAWAALWSVLLARGGMYSWHYFAAGAAALSHPGTAGGGLHVYAAHPQLQIGPLALVAAVLLTAVGGPLSAVLGSLLMTMLGLISLWLLVAAEGSIRRQPPSPRATLLAGLPLIPVWATLGVHYGHLDDALAITLTVAALVALLRDRPWAATALLGAAAAAKPWALPFGLLLLAHPADRTRRAAAYAGLSVLPWVPFLIADPHTLQRLGSFVIVNAPDSALRALGVHAATTPPWDRTAQLVVAAALGLWCLRTGRAVAIPAIALASRLLLDPGTYPYYTASLLLAVVCVDLLHCRRRSLPWLTLAVAAWFVCSGALAAALGAAAIGAVRAVFLIALIGCLAALGEHRNPFPWVRRPATT